MKYFLSIFFVALCSFGFAQEAFMKAIGTDNIEHGVDICMDSNGNVYVVSSTNAVASSYTDILLTSLDNQFNCLWSYTYGSNFIHQPVAMDIAEDELYIVSTVLTPTTSSYDIEVMKVGLDGIPVWTQSFGNESWDIARDIRVVGNSIYVIAETQMDGVNQAEVFILDKTTGISFTPVFLTQGNSDVEVMAFIVNNGRYYAAIAQQGATYINNYFLNGVLAWSSPLEFVDGGEMHVKDFSVFGANVYYAGERILDGNTMGFYGGVDNIGNIFMLTSEVYSGDYGYCGVFVSDSRIVLPGFLKFAGAGGKDAFVHILTQDQVFLGAPTFGDSQDDYFDKAIVMPNGYVLCAGTTFSYGEANGNSMALMMTEATFGDYSQYLDTNNDCFIVSVQEALHSSNRVIEEKYYLMDGREVEANRALEFSKENIVICRKQYSNGEIEVTKFISK